MSQTKLSQSQQILLALNEASQKLEKLQKRIDEPIAIIGIGCRLPGADDPAAFWELLRNGVDTVTEIPADRWDVDRYYDPNPDAPGKMYTRSGSFINQPVDQFDPGFFGISPREANSMDPQHRLLLEVTWEALEHAGLPPDQLWLSKTGVFIGISTNDYTNLHAGYSAEELGPHFSSGTLPSFAAGRIAYLLGLQGPNVQVDTACSSSLVGVHLACQSLRTHESDLALAGGVNLILAPDSTIGRCRLRAVSPDGRCKTFDAAADGYGQGEGCGVVVLKRLSDALAARDTILAIIPGSAVNHNGPSSGLLVPNEAAQARLIQEALKNAKLSPEDIGYLEAHGTGTSLGDPIEVNAIGAVFGKRKTPLVLGSVKSNIGHLEAAAGVVGLIKTVLTVAQGTIPPHLHLQSPNPYIAWDQLPIQVPTHALPWPAAKRIAGVSSFGLSGTNVHVIVAQAPGQEKREEAKSEEPTRPAHLLTLSAKSTEALHAYAQRYVDFLTTDPTIDLGDLCYTSHIGRSHFSQRLSVVAASVAELQSQLQAYTTGEAPPLLAQGSVVTYQAAQKVAFLFTGQGAQYLEMGRDLYAKAPADSVFRTVINRCEAVMQAELGRSLLDLLYPTTPPTHTDLMTSHPCGQAVNFALECALADLWRSWGVQPALVLGHSLGDFAAAYTAGVLSLEEGLRLVITRGRLMEEALGSMLSVIATEAEVAPYLTDVADVAISVINGPRSIVISGGDGNVALVAERLQAAGYKTRKLDIPVAAHSPMLDPVLDAFEAAVRQVTLKPPTLPVVSSMTGQRVTHELTTSTYWRHHLRNTVRFADGVATLAAEGCTIFLEIGPKPTLLNLAEQVLDTLGDKGTASPTPPVMLPSLRQNHPDWQQMLLSLGELYVRGVAIDWAALDQGAGAPNARRKVALPTYPFQRQRYWLMAGATQEADAAPQDGFAQWLATHSIEELTDRLTGQGTLADADRATVAKVISALVAENRAQQQRVQVEPLLYEVTWERQRNRSAVTTASMPAGTNGRWLLLADQQGIGAALAAQLQALGEVVTLFHADTPLPTVLQALTATTDHDLPWRGVVHLWALDETLTESADLTRLQASPERTLGSVLQVMQRLAGSPENGTKNNAHSALAALPPRLWVVTQQAQAITATETVAVMQTPLWGMGRVIALEHGEHWGGLIDLDRGSTPDEAAQPLLAELQQARTAGEEQVAYRQGERYVARLAPARPATSPTARTITAEGTYLITGGLGGLGLHSLRWLVEQGARHLLVTGRRGVQTPQQQTILAELQATGAEIQVAQVDVADEAAMTQLLQSVAATAYPLRGVIHAAGVEGFQPLQSLQWAEFARVLHPKVMGGWLLHRLTLTLELDFFICYASGAGIWGSKQQAHYAAANHFLDGLMAYRRSLGLPGLSIAWGPWAGGGMASPEVQEMLAAIGVRTFTPEQGLAIQAHLLQTTASQVTAVDMDWARLKALYELNKPRHFLARLKGEQAHPPATEAGTPAARPAILQELQALPLNQRLPQLRRYVQQVVGRVLQMPTLPDSTTGFADLGMDSLMTLEVRRQLERSLHCTLPATIAFEYPTVDELASYLLSEVLALTVPAPVLPPMGDGSREAIGLHEPIAVVSMACRLPGADSPEAFWRLLQSGVDMVQAVPPSRWLMDDYYDPQRPRPGKSYVREAALLDDVASFDAFFFGIAPREVMGMDPQQRLLLEVGWEVIERAGLTPTRLADSQTGVFIGISASDYADTVGIQSIDDLDLHTVTNTSPNAAAGRLAYTLGLQGPAMAIDTACSSSLVAIHLACQSLRTGECDLALAGGVSLMFSPYPYIALSQMQALAPDGRCKTFDAAADGYGRGEGGGMVLLKRLSEAEADGDTILAVIKGSAVNHDGHSSGLTVPNKRAQEKLIRQVLATAQVRAEEVGYIEAHGTGTALGDPIEIRALGAVFTAERPTPLLVGSVKTNVGHLEAAAGITGFIKTVLALHHQQLPPHLHFHTPNPYIEWNDFAIQVPTVLQPWPTGETGALLAGVSAFGISGTNAHVLVAAPQAQQTTERRSEEISPAAQQTAEQQTAEQQSTKHDGKRAERSLHLLPLSTKQREALPALAARYHSHLQQHPDLALETLCYTAGTGRSHFNQRLAIIAGDQADLAAKLAAVAQQREYSGLIQGTVAEEPPRIAFLFTGQGSQYVEMGRTLYETEPIFRAALDRCEALYRDNTGESLLAALYTTATTDHQPLQPEQERSSIDDTTYTQPALFALEYALATLWQSWGVQPEILIGHSVGEVAAACIAGVFSLEDGMKLIAARGRLMGALPHDGAMVAVTATEAEVQRALAAYAAETERIEVAIAAINGPTSVVISGQRDAVNAVVTALTAEPGATPDRTQGAPVKIKNLNVSHAFHSPLMEPMLAEFGRVAAGITYHEPKLALIANVTGKLAGAEISTPAYWVRHVRDAVRFADGVATLLAQGIDTFLEIGPQPVLIGMAQTMIEVSERQPATRFETERTDGQAQSPIPNGQRYLPSLRPTQPDWQQMLTTAGELYVRGATLAWEVVTPVAHRQKVLLPTYPFQRQRFWPEQVAPAHKGAAHHGIEQWLTTNHLDELTTRITARLTDATDETARQTVTKVLTALAAERQTQELTTQIDALLYGVRWERLAPLPPVLPPETPGRWLILADTQGIGEQLATALSALGEAVELFTPATALPTIIERVAATESLPLRGILHLWAITDEPYTERSALLAQQARNLDSLLQIVQTLAVATPAPDATPRIWVMTQGAQQLTATEAVAVAQTPLWGLGRVIALEHSELWGGLIDLDEASTPQILLADLLQSQPDSETQTLYRRDLRYGARLAHQPLPAQPQAPVIVHAQATYLITGGLGGLGLRVAEWLAEQGAQHLVLTGRHGITTPSQQAIVDQLTAAGVTVQVAPVDVADERAMGELFAQFANSEWPLKGVVHTAGVLDDAILLNQQWARFARVLASKVTGGWLLHQLTAPLDLDFMVFFSSLSALVGNPGQGNYAAANAFLDGLARYRQQQGLPGVSINWGAWAEVGMAARTDQLALADGQWITPPIGMNAFAHLVGRGAAGQWVVAPIDWTQVAQLDRRAQRFYSNFVTVTTPLAPLATPQAGLAQELAELPVSRRTDHLRRYLQATVGRVLGMRDLPELATGFAELGMDSLMALELRRQLERAFDAPLPTTIAFDYPTIDKLGRYLLDDLLATRTATPLLSQRSGAREELALAQHEPIAVISMACRFPGADTPEAFWQLLQAGADLVREVPATRWAVGDFYDPQRPTPGKMYMREAAFIDNVAEFDPLFFGIAPREAVGMDPQHRLLLEISWETLERAGLAQYSLVDSQTGVFVGIGPGDYGIMNSLHDLAELDTHLATNSGHSVAAGRLAHTLGLQGPTLAVDTACSSSLVALHLACQSLRLGECDLALAGGVNLMLSPLTHVALSQMQALAADGRCKTFDAAADGYGRGEGGGMVLLKRLRDAEADGDTILAVIKGSAVNHDGASSGLTVPNRHAQVKVLHQALTNAQVRPDEIAYIEVHGTGTALGDPIEVGALGEVFGNQRPTPLVVGSVKTNVGHLEAAAGIAGFIKTVLALQHQQIPPHLHFHTPSPYIAWDQVAITVATELQPWPQEPGAGAAFAGISSFGLSGTNAHVVVAAPPSRSAEHSAKPVSPQLEQRGGIDRADAPAPTRYLLPLSAKSVAVLPALAGQYSTYVATQPTLDLGDLCYTAAVGRNHFNQRLALIVQDQADLQRKLTALHHGDNVEGVRQGVVTPNTPRIAFLFTGQGAQYVDMGRTLYTSEPTFRAIVDRCEALYRDYTGESLLAVLYPEVTTEQEGSSVIAQQLSLDDTTYTQPALFALEYALATLWQSWGVQPAILIGHSVGEVAAACVAGVFSLEDGMKLIAARGRLMGALPQDGAMIAVTATEAAVQQAIAADAATTELAEVAIAAVNGPENVVISGQRDAVNAVAARLAAGTKLKNLNVSHAFHSPLMAPMLEAFQQVAETITYHEPHTPLVSNVTGALAGTELLTPAYWVRHVREAVRFGDGMATLSAQGIDLFLEIGPKPVLLGMAGQGLTKEPRNQGESAPDQTLSLSPGQPFLLPSLRQEQDDWQQMLTALGELYVRGVAIDWQAVTAGEQRRKLLLPTYPFQRQRYWLEESQNSQPAAQARFAQWLAAQSLDALTARITARGNLAPSDQATVAKVLQLLEAEQQAQEQAAEVERMLYEITWEPQRLPLTVVPPVTAGHWLILADEVGVGAALATRLTALGESVDLVQTLAELRAYCDQVANQPNAERPLRGVLHLWAIQPDEQEAAYTAASLLQRQERNLHSVIQMVQRLVALQMSGGAARLWVVTRGAQQLTASAPIAIDQTPLWGLGRTITLEHGELWGALLDLDPAAEPAAAAQALLADLLQPAGSEEQIAYRAGERYVARLVPLRLDANSSAPAMHATSGLAIDAEGAYLITGGLGYLGLQTARWLVEQGARHLILTGRRGVQNKQQQALLDDLQAMGVTIQIATVDVADEAAMTEFFSDLAASAYPLRGIIHQAGVLGYQPVQTLTWDEVAAVLRPKVLGGWLLHQLTADLALDFFICYSSGAAIWGSKQQAHYGAANHFLDGLMAYRRSLGLPGLSIAWGPWGGGGMASPDAQAQLLATGVRAFAPEEALAIQSYLLQNSAKGNAASQITAAAIDWARLKPLYELTKPRRFLAHLGTAPVAAAAETPAALSAVVQKVQGLPATQRLEALASHVSATVSQVLDLGNGAAATLATATGFTDLGMDSLMALEIRRALEGSLHCSLPATLAFEYPTVDALANYLLHEVLALPTPVSHPQVEAAQQPTAKGGIALDEPIAVISMACRFPGADTPEAFWQLLQTGADLVGEVPSSRWLVDEFYSAQRPMPGKMYTRNAAFITGVEGFDPLFFGISPREATSMDPHHRLLLEVTWELLERAGIAPNTLVDSQTGVFIGIGTSDYGALSDNQDLTSMDTYTVTSSGNSAAAGRLAYTLGLQGPTMAVDTACSSSLVSLHLACQSLRTGECELALAGGVSLMLSPLGHIALSQIQSLAPDGRCKTFDAAADGYGRGEGSGLVLLKRLRDAERDSDTILAVIKGSAVNHDGPSSGLTVPNKRAQEKLIRQALSNAGVTPDEVGYIEAHGTGTSLGDPIEIRALGAVFGAPRAQPLLVGSVKTNMGHLEQAAGIAGFMKTVLALQHQAIPPHLHFQTPNPYIEWDEVALAVPTQLQSWPCTSDSQPLVAGVSAFGISGTNAHVVVAAAPALPAAAPDWGGTGSHVERPLHLLTLSAKTPAALATLTARYHAHVQAHPALDLADLCHTALVGRNHFQRRLAIVAADRDELQRQLAAVVSGQHQENSGILHGAAPANRTRVAFLFTGQGAQYVGMGRQLYETQPLFRAVIERCDAVAHQALGRSLIDLLYPATTPDHNDIVESHPCGQAVNFAVQCALVELWRSWGIHPDLVLGHSLGDFAAAYAAGVLSLEDGLRLVSTRGRLMEQAVGSMVAVLGSETEVAPFVAPYDDVVIGVINGPRNVVISGGHAHVHAAATALDAAGFKTRKVAVPMAAHSPLLDPVLDAFEQFIRTTITLHTPQRPVVSSMSGQLVTTELTDPAYWRNHLRNPVRFVDGVQTLAAEGATIFIEVGPKPTLLGMVEPSLEAAPPAVAGQSATPLLLPSLRQNEDEWRQMLTTLGELYVRGFAIAWPGVQAAAAPTPRRKLLLPTYPFQRERYWLESSKGKRSTATLRPLIDNMMKSPALKATLFETAMSAENLPFLTDHRVYGTIVAPGASHLAMVLSAAELAFPAEQPGAGIWHYELSDVIFPQALAVEDDETRTAQVIFKPGKRNGAGPHADFELISFATAPYAQEELSSLNHASGKVGLTRQDAAASVTLADLQVRFTQPVTALPASRIAQEAAPLYYGPAFQWLEAAWQLPTPATGNEQPTAVLARLRRPDAVKTVAGYPLHPGLLDSCFQTTALVQTMTPQSELYLPFAVAEMHFAGPTTAQAESDQWWCYTEQVDALKWNLWIFTNEGRRVAMLQGFELRAASPAAIQTTRLRTDWLYGLTWEATPLPQTLAEMTTNAPDGWLIFDRAAGLGGALATALPTSSTSTSPFTLLVQPGHGFAIHSQQQVTVDPTDPTAFSQLLTYVATRCPTANATVGVVYLWGLADPAADPAQQALTLTGGLLHLTQALLATTLTARLWVVTEGCQSLPQAPTLIEGRQGQPDPTSVAAFGALWGLGRTLGRELPQLQTVCLDLEREATPAQQIDLLRQELLAGVDATPAADGPLARQVTYRSGTRYVAGLQPWQAPARVDAAHPMRVQFNDYGGPEQIALAPMTRRPPGRDEIEVEVEAAGLNFRDVLNMLGMMKEYYATALGITQAKDIMVGFECAGVVTAVGADVTAFAVGDRVMGLGLRERTFASYVTVPALQMTHIPSHLNAAEAATIPLTFMTAWYGLIELAKLQPGEWILIHAASGGVGQAAVQIALALGAQVIATASPGKWHLLQRQGVVQTLNSRTVDFAATVLQLTGGRGVDVVLNSLNGDFIEQSFAALDQGGRFVEIGKLGIWSQATVAERRPDVAYYPFDLGEEILGEPELQTRLWAAITAQLQAGVLQPLPYRTFPVYEISAAFRYMQQAKQFGKLVITFPQQPPSIRPDATYLITGGLGALGLEAAKQLVSAGAKHLVLTGRRGVTTEEQRTTLAQLAEAGATVQIVPADISHGKAVADLLHTCQQSAPLRGIIHAAGLLDDGVVPAQTMARLADVMRPKVDGAWHLHQATQTMALDFFVCFSSSSALLGSPGQSNYTAANAFMDTLMQQRMQQGQPGLSINWGPWASVGMAVGLEERMQAQGLLMISPQQGRLLLQYLLQQPVAQVGVVPLQPQRPPEIEEQPKTLPLRAILAALPSQERGGRLEAFVRSMIATVLGLRDSSALEMDTRLFDFGLDSLMAVELKNKLAAGLDCTLRSTLLFDYPTLDVLLPHLLHDVLQLPDDAGAPSTEEETDDLAQIAAVQELSQEDLLSLLNAEIEDIL